MEQPLAGGSWRERDATVPERAAPAAELRDAWVSYRRGRPVLRGVSFAVEPGEITMVVGPSGGGKTTVLKLLKGLVAADRGEVSVLGRQGKRGGWRLDPSVAYIPQHLGLVRSRTVLANTVVGGLSRMPWWRSLTGLYPREVVAEARETLAALGIAGKADERVRSLSGGERQRVAIARALLQHPRLILADEFVSHLDAATTEETLRLAAEVVTRTGAAMVMTTHELDLVRFAKHVVLIRDGVVELDAAASSVDPAALREHFR